MALEASIGLPLRVPPPQRKAEMEDSWARLRVA
jgi:hypothetical protein